MEPSAKTVRVKRMSEECLQNLQMQVNFDPKYSTAKTMSLQFMHDMHGSMHEQLCMLCKTVTKFKKRGWPPSSRFNNMYIVDMFFACWIHHIIIRYYRCICYVCCMYCIPPITRLDSVWSLFKRKKLMRRICRGTQTGWAPAEHQSYHTCNRNDSLFALWNSCDKQWCTAHLLWSWVIHDCIDCMIDAYLDTRSFSCKDIINNNFLGYTDTLNKCTHHNRIHPGSPVGDV